MHHMHHMRLMCYTEQEASDGGSKDVASVSTCITLQLCRHTNTSNCLETVTERVSDGRGSRQLAISETTVTTLTLSCNAKTKAWSSTESKSIEQHQHRDSQEHRERERQRDAGNGNKTPATATKRLSL